MLMKAIPSGTALVTDCSPVNVCQACQLDADLPLPHYGLAQLYLQQREDKNAITELEAVMKLVPGSVDALKVRQPLSHQQM